MSCEKNRGLFFRHMSGPGTAAETIFGGGNAAVDSLEEIFETARNKPFNLDTPQGKAVQILAQQKTHALFQEMKEVGIQPPSHSVSGLPSEDAQRGYAVIWDVYEALRKGKPLPSLAEQIRQKNMKKRLAAIAPDLRTDTGGVNTTSLAQFLETIPVCDDITRFTQQTLTQAVSLAPVGGGIGKGVSGAPVYIVRDDQQPIAIVKVFPNIDQFGEDISALTWFKEQHFKTFQTPSILNVAIRDSAGIMITSLAKGYPLDDILRQATLTNTYKEVYQSIQHTASALGELHQVTLRRQPPSASTVARHVRAMTEIHHKITTHPIVSKFWNSTLSHRVERLLHDIQQSLPHESVVIHGDAHPGNFFYDRQEGVTLIDTPTVHRALDRKGRATEFAARDVSNFYEKLYSFGRVSGIPKARIHDLQHHFLNTYGHTISPVAHQFFQHRTALGELLHTVRYVEQGVLTIEDIRIQIDHIIRDLEMN